MLGLCIHVAVYISNNLQQPANPEQIDLHWQQTNFDVTEYCGTATPINSVRQLKYMLMLRIN